jgi:hypothetical protein
MAGGPDNGLLIFSVTPADQTSKLLSFHDPEQHGGCPRFPPRTWGTLRVSLLLRDVAQ